MPRNYGEIKSSKICTAHNMSVVRQLLNTLKCSNFCIWTIFGWNVVCAIQLNDMILFIILISVAYGTWTIVNCWLHVNGYNFEKHNHFMINHLTCVYCTLYSKYDLFKTSKHSLRFKCRNSLSHICSMTIFHPIQILTCCSRVYLVGRQFHKF